MASSHATGRRVWIPRRTGNRNALSLVEIMIAVMVFGICVIPTIGLYDLGYETATVSEDRIYAENLAIRILEVWNVQPFNDLAALVGTPQDDVVTRIFNTDSKADWFAELPEYARNLGVGKNFFRGRLEVFELAPGLLSLEVSVTWEVLEGAKEGQARTYRLLLLRSREDLSVDNGERAPLDQ